MEGMNPADVTKVRRHIGLRIAVVGVILAVAGAPVLGVLVLLLAAWASRGELVGQGAGGRVGQLREPSDQVH